jgi:hypothetical protein
VLRIGFGFPHEQGRHRRRQLRAAPLACPARPRPPARTGQRCLRAKPVVPYPNWACETCCGTAYLVRIVSALGRVVSLLQDTGQPWFRRSTKGVGGPPP